MATDSYGNVYVASIGNEIGNEESEGRIDIFNPKGFFITEVSDLSRPGSLAIDSEGNLYVANLANSREERIVRYSPTGTYDPAKGEIEYSSTPSATIAKVTGSSLNAVAVNPVNDHLFVKFELRINEYKSAAAGNEFIEEIAGGELLGDGVGLAVDAARGRIYASTESAEGPVVKVFELPSPHALLFTIKPPAKANSVLSIAVDEGNGHVFIYEGEAKKVYELDEDGTFTNNVIEHSFQKIYGGEIGVDNGKFSPNGALNSQERYLYVPSNPSGIGHSYAFGPPKEGEPKIESISFANVGEEEAELQASIEPFGLETHYTFSIGGQVVGEGDIPAGNSPVDVAAAVEGLEPGTRYSFRVFVENTKGTDEEEGEFATFPEAGAFASCPNDTLRTGFSALLPDCRAYELVTPPDTNARAPLGLSHLGAYFATRQASPSGEKVTFQIEGGLIPGSEGTGSLYSDPYLSTRGEDGWGTAGAGPNGSEATALLPGSTSPDQGYSFWTSSGGGSATIGSKDTSYVRYPDGHSALVGRGSLGIDPRAAGKLISEGGTHIIFVSGGIDGPAVRLETDAPPSGTKAVYDRTSDEVTHVISLLPESKTPAEGEDALYIGASLDGRGVAFEIGNTLYLRYDNQETYELGEGVTFAGIAEGGARAFYLEGGKLWRFDATTGQRTEFSTGPVTPVNVSADGSVAYFVSTAILTGEPNPNEEFAVGGKENLYRSEEGELSFVGTVTERDVVGELKAGEQIDGLGLWAEVVGISPSGNAGRLAADPSRTTPDGSVLLFESRADLDGYDPEGHAEVYRYDIASNELSCLSCNPTLAPATSDASLQSISASLGDPEPLRSFDLAGNLRADGRRAFFQSDEALVPTDVDGLQDIYEWEAQGIGSCEREGGCVYLVSSGHSLRTDYLYATSDTGDDVFFRTGDILLPRDAEATPSIYDARVGGGFAEPVEEECIGEGCKPGVSPAPVARNLGSEGSGPTGNLKPACPKGKHKAKRHGRTVCIKKKKHKYRKHHHHKRAGKSRGAGK